MTPLIINYVDQHFDNEMLVLIRNCLLAIEVINLKPDWEPYEQIISSEDTRGLADIHDAFIGQINLDFDYIISQHYVKLYNTDLATKYNLVMFFIDIMSQEANQDAMAILASNLPPKIQFASIVYLYEGIDEDNTLSILDEVDPFLLTQMKEYLNKQDEVNDRLKQMAYSNSALIKNKLDLLKSINNGYISIGQHLFNRLAPIGTDLEWYLKETEAYFNKLSSKEMNNQLFNRICLDSLSLLIMEDKPKLFSQQLAMMGDHFFDEPELINKFIHSTKIYQENLEKAYKIVKETK